MIKVSFSALIDEHSHSTGIVGEAVSAEEQICTKNQN